MIAPARLVSFDHLPGSTSFDDAVRTWIVARQTPPAIQIAAFLSKVCSPGWMRWFGMAAAVLLLVLGRRRAAVAMVAAPWLALAAYSGIRRILPRARPPGVAGYHEAASSFPSAHSTTSAAVCCALAYLVWREHLVPGPAALAIAIRPPLFIGLSRVYLDVHWSTDVLGGWGVGLVIMAIAIAVYRLLPAAIER